MSVTRLVRARALGRYVRSDKLTARCSRAKCGLRHGWLQPVGRDIIRMRLLWGLSLSRLGVRVSRAQQPPLPLQVISDDSEASQGGFGKRPTCCSRCARSPTTVQPPWFANCAIALRRSVQSARACESPGLHLKSPTPITNLLQTVVRTLLYMTWLSIARRNIANDVAASSTWSATLKRPEFVRVILLDNAKRERGTTETARPRRHGRNQRDALQYNPLYKVLQLLAVSTSRKGLMISGSGLATSAKNEKKHR
jgi:hypothetical protein